MSGQPRNSRPWRSRAGAHPEDGMTTAEYAVGTVAAAGFAGILVKVLSSGAVSGWLQDLVHRALSLR